MGVTQLWNILEPIKQDGSHSTLRGKCLSVDLSGWICEAHGAKGLKTNVLKPHLRNLFFRVWHLTRCGVKLVFVVDGDPPELKWEAIMKRTEARLGQSNGGRSARGGAKGPRRKVGRSNFRIWVNECTALLTLLGVPFVESAGEAEALCAWLDAQEIVDGCITNDGDAFLYGARTVYKDLCISAKECSMECFSIEDIKAQLGLGREGLVALAVLLGCDYLPQGVPGIGKELSLKLVRELNNVDLIKRFHEWSNSHWTDDCMSNIEKNVRRKALQVQGFPNQKVISEFLSPNLTKKRISIPRCYKCPDLKALQEFCLKYMEWPEDYTSEKVLPLVTYWNMNCEDASSVVCPERVLKARVQQKVECYEVLWKNCGLGDTCQPSFATIETKEIFREAYPTVTEEFEDIQREKLEKKSGRQRKKQPSTTVEQDNDLLTDICSGIDTLSLTETTSRQTGAVDEVGTNEKETVSSTFLPRELNIKPRPDLPSKSKNHSKKHRLKNPEISRQNVPKESKSVSSRSDQVVKDYGMEEADMVSKLLLEEFQSRQTLESKTVEVECVDLTDSDTELQCELPSLSQRLQSHGKNSVSRTNCEVDTKTHGKDNVKSSLKKDELYPKENEDPNMKPTGIAFVRKDHSDRDMQVQRRISEIQDITEMGKHSFECKGTSLETGHKQSKEEYTAWRPTKTTEDTVETTIPRKVINNSKKVMKEVYFSDSDSDDEDSWMEYKAPKEPSKHVSDNERRKKDSELSKEKVCLSDSALRAFNDSDDIAILEALSLTNARSPLEVREDMTKMKKLSTKSKSKESTIQPSMSSDDIATNDKAMLAGTLVSSRRKEQVANEIKTSHGFSYKREEPLHPPSTPNNMNYGFPSKDEPSPLPSTPVFTVAANDYKDVDSPLDEVFLPLSLSERLGKHLKGREGALNSLRSLSSSSAVTALP